MAQKIFSIIFVLVICLGLYINAQPDEMNVSRSTFISASAAKIFPHVNNFHNWNHWSPWAKLDPNATFEFTGAEQGVGARFSWNGNNQVGVGSNTIVKSIPNQLVQIDLVFEKPFASTATAEFTFDEEGKQTRVTWSMFGKKNFISKAMGLVMDCHKMVGDQFDEGLANLKTIVEQ